MLIILNRFKLNIKDSELMEVVQAYCELTLIMYLFSRFILIKRNHWNVFCKNDAVENFAKFRGKHLYRSLSSKKKTPAQLFHCIFFEIFKNTFFAEHLQKVDSVCFCLLTITTCPHWFLCRAGIFRLLTDYYTMSELHQNLHGS